MSDLRGFSELSERLGPQAMIDLLNRYLAAMTRVIHAHGGMINEFIGDAILVLFGAPFQRDDDPETRGALRVGHAAGHGRAERGEPPAGAPRARHGHRRPRGPGGGGQYRQPRPRQSMAWWARR